MKTDISILIKSKKNLGTTLLSLLLFLNISCNKNQQAAAEKRGEILNENQITLNENQMKNINLQTAVAETSTLADKLQLSGKVEVRPDNLAAVAVPGGGYIRKFSLVPGQFVRKGQVLAIVENPSLVQLQQEYLLAKSNLSYTSRDYNRQKDLNKNLASSDKVTERANTEMKNQHIMMQSMAAELRAMGIRAESLTADNIRSKIPVRAPISGYISGVFIKTGQYVSPDQPVAEIINSDAPELVLEVFEKDLNKLQSGQRIFAYTNDNPEKKYPAEIYLLGKDFSADRSVTVRARFINLEMPLLAGTFLNAEVEIHPQEGIVLPEDAVVTWENKPYIFEEINPRTFGMVPVNIGNTEDGKIQLLNFDPRKINHKFVIKGAYNLLMALKNEEEE